MAGIPHGSREGHLPVRIPSISDMRLVPPRIHKVINSLISLGRRKVLHAKIGLCSQLYSHPGQFVLSKIPFIDSCLMAAC